MKRIFAFTVLFASLTFPVHAFAAPVVVAHTVKYSPDGNSITSDAIDTSGADFCFAAWAYLSGSTSTVFSDSKSNTWTALTDEDNGTGVLSRAYVFHPTVGSGHTFSFSAALASYPSLIVVCYSGGTTAFDAQNGNTGSGVTALTTGSITPSATTDLVIAAINCHLASASIAVDSSYTLQDSVIAHGNNFGMAVAWKVPTSGAQNPSFSWTTSSTAAAGISSFTVPGGGGAVTHNLMTTGVGQ